VDIERPVGSRDRVQTSEDLAQLAKLSVGGRRRVTWNVLRYQNAPVSQAGDTPSTDSADNAFGRDVVLPARAQPLTLGCSSALRTR
jgi:hypothetical protein